MRGQDDPCRGGRPNSANEIAPSPARRWQRVFALALLLVLAGCGGSGACGGPQGWGVSSVRRSPLLSRTLVPRRSVMLVGMPLIHRFSALAVILAASVASAQQGTLSALDYRAPVPANWTSRTPSSSMRLAEYLVGGEGSKVEVVVYFFGQGQGGSADANIERWREQFSSTPAGQGYEKIEEDRGGAFPITVAEWRGTYARGIGPRW